MRYKAMFVAGLATGYVLGAKAGRERYEAIRRAGQRVVENPSVQEAAGVLQAQASDYAGTARRKFGDKLDDAFGDRVPERLRTRIHAADGSHPRTSGRTGA